MIKYQWGRIMVNNEVQNLPVEMGSNLVTVIYSNNMAVLQTNFGLRVSYDWNSRLLIQLPSSYYGSVCGLCGDFNGNSKDELRNPAGKAVPSILDWTKSWRVPDPQDPNCSDDCQEGCPTCDGKLRKQYETEDYCGALTKADSVFQQCHDKVDPKAFMENCAYDMCLLKGDKQMLCQALTSYSEMCLKEGIVLKGWRNKFGCPMSCQPHSHYEACASPCPLTCPITEQDSPVCLAVCSEGCVCDKGYALSAGKCVPAKECGCSYQGRYYEPGQSFWGDEGCQQLCMCDQDLGMVVCRQAGCKATERCTVEDGVRACRPLSYSTCVASGDPHYRTFDGRRFNFQGTCVYQLVALCSKDPSLTAFEVTVQNDHRKSEAVSFTKVVTVQVYGITITISRDYRFQIMVDGQFTSMPFQYEDKLVVFRSCRTAVVETAFGMRVTFNWNSVVTVTLPNTYQGAVCGLCGNYNQNPSDDGTQRDGKAAASGSQLGESWRVDVVPGCTSGCTGPECKDCSASQIDAYRAQRYCGIIADKTGPFRDCHARVDPAPYLEDCAFDACHFEERDDVICEAVAAYVSACQNEGVAIQSWRSSSFCPVSCPKNSHYELCSSGCPATCAIMSAAARCHLPCQEGCQCDEGHLLSGDACVPVAECGCSYGGRYYKQRAVFYTDKCQEQCKCGENGAVECQTFKCGPGEACKVVGGVNGCYPVGGRKCVASGDPHYVSLDGRHFDFQGACAYTLTKVCDKSDKQLVSFAVDQSTEKRANGRVSVTKAVAVAVYGYVITIEHGVRTKVIVNNTKKSLPLSLDEGRITVNKDRSNIIVSTDFGLRVLYNAMYYVEVVVPSAYEGKMCGLCGNYNDDHMDDFLLPSGEETGDVDDFGNAWTISSDDKPECSQAGKKGK
ncbi:IgGFc-binding protein-like [Anguilla anguilla]|uniref:IgGFc-binding protein-like n=1 Tax=Anguilla anguilla TaxID=7936 RepID=UPI0015AB83A4|nr:IgGFc-binding protein-like [Anguilla anguilla]